MTVDLGTRAGHTHKLFRKTAMAICAAAYEELAKDNNFFRAWPVGRRFVQLHWPQFLSLARQHLIEALGQPNLPEAAKEEIFDAILKDRALQQRIAPGSAPLMH